MFSFSPGPETGQHFTEESTSWAKDGALGTGPCCFIHPDLMSLMSLGTYFQVEQLQRYQRTPSTTSEDSIRFHSSGSLDLDSKEAAEEPKEVNIRSSSEKAQKENREDVCLCYY